MLGKNTCLLCDSLLHLNDDIIARKNSFIIEFDYRDASQTTADFTIAIGNLGTINIYLSEQVKINKNCYYQSVNSSSIGEIKFYARSNVGDYRLVKSLKKARRSKTSGN